MAQVAVICGNPSCKARYRVLEALLGKQGRCKKCGTTFVLTRGGAPPSTPLAAGNGVPLHWEPGQVILDLYEVRPLPGEPAGYAEGGMGRVNLVWHRAWQVELAVKSVQPGLLHSASAVESFQREAEVWVDQLGLHPHVVSCYYVRVLGGLPRVFVEYLDGGSLEDWIASRWLYEGGPEQALGRILDISIQFAWGLQHAHEQGLIHQDVKPANVMMTRSGVAKVSDFGLAGARAGLGEPGERPAGATLLASWGGMTRAYCSPEQAEIEAARQAGEPRERWPKLTRRSDVWSWGVSVLEMFLGEVCWPSGSVAQHCLDNEAEDAGIPKMPASVAELLRHCLQPRPEDRPANLLRVAEALRRIYSEVAGAPYGREAPRPTALLADTLNNRALSLLDLGKQTEAEERWQQALTADAAHPEATYNRGLVLWRGGRINDTDLVKSLRAAAGARLEDWKPVHALGQVHAVRGDWQGATAALQSLSPTDAARPEVLALREHLQQRLALPSAAPECTLSGHQQKVISLCLSGDGRFALSGSGDDTVKLWELSSGRCLHTFAGHTAGVYSVSFSADGRLILSGSWDRTLRLWDLKSRQCLCTFEGHTDTVASAHLTRDGRFILSGSWDRTLKLWEAATGRCLQTLEGHDSTVESVSLSGDSRFALSVSSEGVLKLWEVAAGRCLHTVQLPKGGSYSAYLSSDARLALAGGSTVQLWEVPGGRCVHTFEGHAEAVIAVCLSSDSRFALSGSGDNTVKLWLLDWELGDELPGGADTA